MANHQIPRRAAKVEDLTGRDANGKTVKCIVYWHRRAGHTEPMFYVVQYRISALGGIEPGSRVTQQFSGARAEDRKEAEMREVRELLAASLG
jgi:hypothetical protein